MRPAAAVITPMTAMVMSIPAENSVAVPHARPVLILPCPLMNPTMRGMLARWHGLRTMLSTPQKAAALNAITGAPSTAWLRLVNKFSMPASRSARLSGLARGGFRNQPACPSCRLAGEPRAFLPEVVLCEELLPLGRVQPTAKQLFAIGRTKTRFTLDQEEPDEPVFSSRGLFRVTPTGNHIDRQHPATHGTADAAAPRDATTQAGGDLRINSD